MRLVIDSVFPRVWVILVVICSFALAACEMPTEIEPTTIWRAPYDIRIIGFITDADTGAPLRNAIAGLYCAGSASQAPVNKDTSDTNGRVYLEGRIPTGSRDPDFWVALSVDGYATWESQCLKSSEDRYRLDILLSRVAPPEPPPPPPPSISDVAGTWVGAIDTLFSAPQSSQFIDSLAVTIDTEGVISGITYSTGDTIWAELVPVPVAQQETANAITYHGTFRFRGVDYECSLDLSLPKKEVLQGTLTLTDPLLECYYIVLRRIL